MRVTVIILFLLLMTGGIQAQNKKPAISQKPIAQGIENQMKNYFMVILTKGPNRGQDSIELAKLQEGHMANINKLAKEGKLILAGPFLDEGNMRGIFVFDAATEDEVKKLTDSDPAIKAGRFAYEIHPWMGSKGLKTLLSKSIKTSK